MYPCTAASVGLNIINQMQARYNVPVGFSDHTLGTAASIAAVALGASVVEKHFTFSKLMYGSDARHSMEPNEFRQLCYDLRECKEIMDSPLDKDNIEMFIDMKQTFEKSIVSSVFIRKGTTITLDHLSFKKPGNGISASMFEKLVGRIAVVNIEKNQQIQWEHLQ